MYDPKLRAQRDYQWGLDAAREEGFQEGYKVAYEVAYEEAYKEGFVLGLAETKIQMLQELLGEVPSSTESLRQMPAADLFALLAELQQRLQPPADKSVDVPSQ